MQKPKISYPCLWEYRIICEDGAVVREKLSEILRNDFDCEIFDLREKNASEHGKFVSLNLKIMISDEKMRNEIFTKIQKISSVKFVL